jgi:putative AlgH/UPF0301 family transcriptional regulator
MSKIITTTFLLKNPGLVREIVASGVTVLVKHNGKIVMEITIPKKSNSVNPPVIKSKVKYTSKTTFSRDDIYNGKYDK